MARAEKGKDADVQEVPGDRRRRDLLAAAYELIAEKGFEGLRTRDVASRAGVNISTLHYYFGTKEALLEAVVLHAAEKFVSEGEATQPAQPSLRHHFETALRTFRKNPQLAIVLQELALRSQRDSTTRAAFRPILKFWNAQVESVIAAEKSAGKIAIDAPARELAVIVTSFIMGATTQLGVNPKAANFAALSRQVEALMTGNKSRS